MSATVIRVENLSKKYFISHQQGRGNDGLRHVISRGVRNLGKKLTSPFTDGFHDKIVSQEEFWALRDVSFEVKKGERIGIIGRNGAGKSTLLKLLSQITEPTTGRIELDGRVASLLEVGTGFHPELTGRENIYLNGAILGMAKAEIKNKFDDIAAFAEIEKFLDTPVKRYSSGMYVRLAFAVAAHLEPEILIVDEVLAVGDVQFQKKCLGKMEEVGKDGRTVLFVSHNLGAIKQLCTKAILLDSGSIEYAGDVDEVVRVYMNENRASARDTGVWRTKQRDCFAEADLLSVSLVDSGGNIRNAFTAQEPINIVIEYQVNLEMKNGVRLACQIQNSEAIIAFTSFEDSSYLKGEAESPGIYNAICTIPANLLNKETYQIGIAIDVPKHKVIVPLMKTLALQISDTSPTSPKGVVRPKLDWRKSRIGGLDAK